MLYFVLGLLSLASLYFFLRCRTMAGAVRQTNRALKEISGELEANRVLKLPAPDREMEELLVTINDALRKIREQHLEYAKREQEFQRQIENISHDLRTPLTSMIGYLDIMDKPVLAPEDREALEVVKRKARFLKKNEKPFAFIVYSYRDCAIIVKKSTPRTGEAFSSLLCCFQVFESSR